MVNILEKELEQVVVDKVSSLNRPDLLRKPLVAFSSAHDSRYLELKKIIGEWHFTPSEILPDAQTVISYFVPFTKPVVLEPKTTKNGSPLWGEAYVVINPYFEAINEATSKYLTDLGFSVAAIPATHTYDPKDMKCKWSHRSAANIAGLGAFGANRMLITKKGSGGRFCTILTSAQLKVKPNAVAKNRCLYLINGSCEECFTICPVNALAPNSFDKFLCQAVTEENKALNKDDPKLCEADTCGKCISICPVSYIK